MTATHRAARRSDEPTTTSTGEIQAEVKQSDPDEASPTPQSQTIHFVNDGFTAFDKVWMRGEELTVIEGTLEWERAKLWIDQDKWVQTKRFGEPKWEQGPWQGEAYDITDPDLTPEERAELQAVNAQRFKTPGKVPSPGITYKKRP